MKAFTSILIFVLVSGCNSPRTKKEIIVQGETVKTELAGNISITGAYALYPLIKKLADEFMTIHPGVTIEVEKAGTGEGITRLLEGKSHLAMISRPLTEEEISAFGEGQSNVKKTGFCPLNNVYLNWSLDLLK